MDEKRIYAIHDDTTIRVYQAYNDKIADEALMLGTFGTTFKLERMTWIKPSFLWMMYRAGWGTKKGQERILAIDLFREGFDEILANAILSHYDCRIYPSYNEWQELLNVSEVRCQWDPERNIYGNPLDRRAIQLGIRGSMIKKYVSKWIFKITDISNDIHQWGAELKAGRLNLDILPKEDQYPVNEDILKRLGM